MNARAQLLLNCDVRTLDRAGSSAAAIAWREGRVIGVGTTAEVLRLTGDAVDCWDAAGATVLPGFIDAHHHPSLVALTGAGPQLRPPAVKDLASFQQQLAAAAARTPEGQWILATGWDELLLSERRAPTRRELDDAAPEHPVLALHYSFHRGVANSRALTLAALGRHSRDPAGGEISRDWRGEPNGLLIERGLSRVEQLAREAVGGSDPAGFIGRLAAHHRALLAAGITRVVDAPVPGDLVALYREALRRGELLVPTLVLPVSTLGYLEPPGQALDGPATGTGEDPLMIGPLKLVFDGGPSCAMCLGIGQATRVLFRTWAAAWRAQSLDPVRIALATQPRLGRRIRTGIRLHDRASALPLTRSALERGFGLAIHAIGNEAVEIALSAFDALGGELGTRGTPRLEHATFLDRTLVSRIADLGVAVVTQPPFLLLPTVASAPPIPGLSNTPLRWLLDAGVKVVGSSDHPCAGFAPLEGMRAAVHRGTAGGTPLDPEQAVTLDEAIAMYTRTAAEVCGCSDRVGTLEVGKRADLVVLDGPLTNAAQLDVRAVSATVLGGEVAFGSLKPVPT